MQPLVLLGVCLLLLSCREMRASYRVALGNYAYAKGDYQKANLNYFKAQALGVGGEIVGYNLGTVFYALGEAASSQELWNSIDPGEDLELAFRLVYNEGILNYRNGNYLEAYENAKSALLFKPTSLAAKINLEHSLSKLNAQETGSQEILSGAPLPMSNSDDIQRILEYIRRQEPIYSPGKGRKAEAGVKDW